MHRIKMGATLFGIALILSLGGCKPIAVLHPLFSESECLFEPLLLGNWEKISPDGNGFCGFLYSDPQEKRYKVNVDNEEMSGWLGKINENYYLDLVSWKQNKFPNKDQVELDIILTEQGYQVKPAVVVVSEEAYLDFRTDPPGNWTSDQSAKIKFRIQPLHTIYKLRLENGQLTIWHLDDENVVKQIETGMTTLAHQKEPFSLITADRLELQEFLKTYGEGEELFEEVGVYRRVAN